ncbi:MAG: hypothetical protein IID41_17420 [Planctomycetes bacterium]|nr:hypothetical protein [Planctomycetota bacterium]
MPKVHSVGGVAKLLDVPPRKVTALFYNQVLPSHQAPIVGGRRLIPSAMIPKIATALGVSVRRTALAS